MADVKKIATRESYGNTLKELAAEGHDDLVVLDADLAAATKTGMFRKAYPDRHFDCGIAEADMMNIAVHPDFRRKGVARGLILALIGELKKRGSRCLTLEVRASNDPARALYESLGFAHVGTRRNYYQNPKEDALILRKEWEI